MIDLIDFVQDFAKSIGIEFVETSAKNSTNVEKAFMVMSTNIKARMKSAPNAGDKGKGQQVKLSSGKAVPANKGGCC